MPTAQSDHSKPTYLEGLLMHLANLHQIEIEQILLLIFCCRVDGNGRVVVTLQTVEKTLNAISEWLAIGGVYGVVGAVTNSAQWKLFVDSCNKCGQLPMMDSIKLAELQGEAALRKQELLEKFLGLEKDKVDRVSINRLASLLSDIMEEKLSA